MKRVVSIEYYVYIYAVRVCGWRARLRKLMHGLPGSMLSSPVPDNSWQGFYNRPLFDLSNMGNEGNQTLRGIFSPRYDQEVIDRYLHTLFLDKAQDYADKYTASAYFS